MVGNRGQDVKPGLGVVITNLDGEVGNEIFVGNDSTANQLWKYRQRNKSIRFSDGWGSLSRREERARLAWESLLLISIEMGIGFSYCEFQGNPSVSISE